MLQRFARLPVRRQAARAASVQLRQQVKAAALPLASARLCFSSASFARPSAPASTLEVATELMRIVRSERDIQEYVDVYGTPGVTRTTVIKIGGEVIENELASLVRSLHFLKQAGLFPILVHGAGPQMNAELAKQGVEPQYVGGNRVTDQETLAIAKRIFLQANRKIVDALVAAGVDARPITSGVFEATFKDKDVYGFVGEVTSINGGAVHAAIDRGQIPVLSCLGESLGGQTLNVNADVAARQLALDLQPYKTIFINSKGGWVEDDGTKLKQIDMARDYERMAARDYTGRQGTLLKLNEINALLNGLPSSSSVALTSASALSREILSSCSAGTVCIKGESSDGEKPSAAALNVIGGAQKRWKVGLIGARGYAGREVIRAVGNHPSLELVCASSRALVGKKKVVEIASAPPLNPHTNRPAKPTERHVKLAGISDALEFIDLGLDDIPTSPLADSVDVWVLALPNGHCDKYAAVLDGLKRKDKLVLDLSADQRFNPAWTYGLAEAPGNRAKLAGASHISNPGCYATGAQLALLPLLGLKPGVGSAMLDEAIPPHVFGVSGYSGAGTSPSAANDPDVLENNILAYKSVAHIHEREVSHQLGTPIRFMPHVGPFFQGIHLTVSAQLKDVGGNVTPEQLRELYEAFYADERLVKVKSGMPLVKDVAFHPHVEVGGFQVDPETGRVVVVAAIDNLLKGAATQAVQNINLALGLDEFAGVLPGHE